MATTLAAIAARRGAGALSRASPPGLSSAQAAAFAQRRGLAGAAGKFPPARGVRRRNGRACASRPYEVFAIQFGYAMSLVLVNRSLAVPGREVREMDEMTASPWPPRVNVWQDPLSPSKWKEEHFVIVSLSGWGLLIYGGYKLFGGGKKDKKEEKLVEAAH
ncbi:hypothetical protein NL676_000808 [Syzygium grande]|nr:hypothetical protein NL676_000808 [Syzygium grande]